MARIKTFPQVIFVTVAEDGTNDWLSANLTKRDALDGEEQKIVGIYKLVESHEVREGPTVSRKRRSHATA